MHRNLEIGVCMCAHESSNGRSTHTHARAKMPVMHMKGSAAFEVVANARSTTCQCCMQEHSL
eukprot:scaffold22089_cov22-Tisochrysis_lutea.AAC.1